MSESEKVVEMVAPNMNRVVRCIQNIIREDWDAYLFDIRTGRIIHVLDFSYDDDGENEKILSDTEYPVWENNEYVGYVWDWAFVGVDSVFLGYINKARLWAIKKKRIELAKLWETSEAARKR